MKLITIIKDIFADIKSVCDEVNDFHHDSMKGHTYVGTDNPKRYHGEGGLFVFLFPNLLGFVTGMALARLFTLAGMWYILFGIVGSIIGGAMHGHLSGTVTFKAGIIRNAIITGIMAFIVGLYIIIVKA